MSRPLVSGLGAACALALATLTGSPVLAAGPTPTPAPGGDPRSPGEGPGFVGEPLVAIGIVVGVALVSVLLTLLYVRLTAERRPR